MHHRVRIDLSLLVDMGDHSIELRPRACSASPFSLESFIEDSCIAGKSEPEIVLQEWLLCTYHTCYTSSLEVGKRTGYARHIAG